MFRIKAPIEILIGTEGSDTVSFWSTGQFHRRMWKATDTMGNSGSATKKLVLG